MQRLHHFIEVADYDTETLTWLLHKAAEQKAQFLAGRLRSSLAGKTLAMIFQKPSLRTRLSFEVAMTQLGGHALHLSQADIGLGQREAVQDIARVVAAMCNAIMMRTYQHQWIQQMAAYSSVPVINALSDYSHPCQAMADMMTISEHFGSLAGRKLAFIGDGNNVARSLAIACGRLAVRFAIASPDGYALGPDFLARARRQVPDLDMVCLKDPLEAVRDADVIYTDTWVSMGQEDQKQQRLQAFGGYQINAKLVSAAPAQAIVMHCLPAYRGCEITEDVLESPRSVVFQQAENRLHFQRALLEAVMVRP